MMKVPFENGIVMFPGTLIDSMFSLPWKPYVWNGGRQTMILAIAFALCRV